MGVTEQFQMVEIVFPMLNRRCDPVLVEMEVWTREQKAQLSNLVAWTVVKHICVSPGRGRHYLKEIVNASTVK